MTTPTKLVQKEMCQRKEGRQHRGSSGGQIDRYIAEILE